MDIYTSSKPFSCSVAELRGIGKLCPGPPFTSIIVTVLEVMYFAFRKSDFFGFAFLSTNSIV